MIRKAISSLDSAIVAAFNGEVLSVYGKTSLPNDVPEKARLTRF